MKRNYIILLLLSVLFAAPGLAAYLFHLHPSWLGHSMTNKGTLLPSPMLMVSPKTTSKWQLLLWNPGACEQACLMQLDKLARIRLALGRHLYKVESALMLNADAPPLSATLMKTFHEQDINIVKLSTEEMAKMPVLKAQPEIFIANPTHYFILSYKTTAKPGDIFHDLKQLVTK